MGYPLKRDFTNIVSSKMIVNCSVMPQDIENADNIFGPDVPSMKGKSVRKRPKDIVSNYVGIPKETMSINTGLEVSVDVMFINKIALLVSVSKQLKFTRIEYTPNKSYKDLSSSNNKIADVYKQQVFSIHTMDMYLDFNCLDQLIVGTDLNITSARYHLPEIE